MFVTTSFQPRNLERTKAEQLASSLEVPYVERQKYNLPELFQQTSDVYALVVTKKELRCVSRTGEVFFFHPNMSALRIKHLQSNQPDVMVTATQMQAGDTVLDCTMGMGADAIVASYAVGAKGKVIALESETAIAVIVQAGLQSYQTDRKALQEAMGRITVVNQNYEDYLSVCESDSVDIVLFDPMFRHTIQASKAMQSLKPLTNNAALSAKAVKEAVRVARKGVFLKERPQSGEFERLGFTIRHRSSRFAWGIIKP
ncbi:class I SAM-dependent methyltransferase [Hazenella sp. IB182357]|uniref:Class I SAM-dependent methyltransferase n=1 Tax=Polycladospora coralii TaxID=2771432 RepID=A0A926NG39_9BACL|nr:class I SAM-dependent methyltransferase [Polycladospora coralii]MBD1372939.1 class I SAM-dependent methyltransferase [Polycladospora coralii]MBS7531004.1 class I SAM-dependent methyltransferase [Polycladospora coralii]